jgi:ankyrin repeat protein
MTQPGLLHVASRSARREAALVRGVSRRGWLKLCAGVLAASPVLPSSAGAYEDYFRAIEGDDEAALRRLLARGMDPNTLDPGGQHGLYLALRGRATKAFQLLLQHPDSRVDHNNVAGETPLMMAALRADLDAMKALVARGGRIERPGWTPLHYAASSPSSAPVQWLLEQGAAANARAPNGNTPLMLAARYGSEESVKLLLQRGADRSLRNDRQLNAADYARLDGREALARWLESGSP